MNIKTLNNLTDLIGQLPTDDNTPNISPSDTIDEPISNESDLADNQAIDEHGDVVDLGYDEDPNKMNSGGSSKDKGNNSGDGFDYFFS